VIKKAILDGRGRPWLERIPHEAPLILDFGFGDRDEAWVQACLSSGHDVELEVYSVRSLCDPRLDAIIAGRARTLVRHERCPTIDEALTSASKLRVPYLELQLALECEEHLSVLKLLTSLGVHTRLEVGRLRDLDDVLSETVADAVTKPGRRAPLSPIENLVRGFFEETFELAQLDLANNDYHVDVRGREIDSELPSWEVPDMAGKRVRFLMDRHRCAFCEGLLVCFGYLDDRSPQPRCAEFFSEFVQLYDALRARRSRKGETRPPGARAC
jgi:hypothetical protein